MKSPRSAPSVAIDQPHSQYPLTPVQIAQRNRGYGMFIHYGINTFHELEWSDGTLPVESYQPTELDCDQWVRVAKACGFRYVILTTKHHDGFCLWTTRHTTYSVSHSPVPVDVVAEVARACERYGLEFGVYYSLWDRNHPSHEDPDPEAYQEYMLAQLEELMTRYGPVCELWLDGGWEKAREDWNIPEVYRRVRAWQPACSVSVNHTIHHPGEVTQIMKPVDMQEGQPIRYWPVDVRLKDPDLARWDDPQVYALGDERKRLPFEHTLCISEHWNWFQKKKRTPARSVDELEQLYYWGTHGDNTLIINLPPDERGLLCDHEVQVCLELAERLGIRNGGDLPTGPQNLTFGADVTVSSGNDSAYRAVDFSLETYWEAEANVAWLALTFPEDITLDQIVVHEQPVSKTAQDYFTTEHRFHIQRFQVQALQQGQWILLFEGTAIGHAKRMDLEAPVSCTGLRLVIDEADAPPRIAHLAASLRSTAGLRPVYHEKEAG